MAFEVVKQIIEVEKEGENLIKDAQSRVQELLKSSRGQAESIIHNSNEEAKDHYSNVISKYERDARDYLVPVQEENRKIREGLMEIPQELLDRAVNLVIERIVNSHGDS